MGAVSAREEELETKRNGLAGETTSPSSEQQVGRALAAERLPKSSSGRRSQIAIRLPAPRSEDAGAGRVEHDLGGGTRGLFVNSEGIRTPTGLARGLTEWDGVRRMG